MITFITGGARSGKSSLAEKIAAQLSGKVLYIATAAPLDEEMEKRIALHKKRRPKDWKTIEEPKNISRVLNKIELEDEYNEYPVILIDCLALLVSNWLPLEEAEDIKQWDILRSNLLSEIKIMLKSAKSLPQHVIIVSNEVGLGVVPEYPLGRLYRDLLGEVNQMTAEAADEVYFMVSGIPMKIKGNQ